MDALLVMNTKTGLPASAPLFWNQPQRFRRAWELQGPNDATGSLRFLRFSGFVASASVGAQQWRFLREKTYLTNVRIADAVSDVEVARFQSKWSGNGTVRFSSGKEFLWRQTNFFAARWAFLHGESQEIVHFRYNNRFLRVESRMDLEPAAPMFPEVDLLLALGWYLILLSAN
jgi:hypothetical protein